MLATPLVGEREQPFKALSPVPGDGPVVRLMADSGATGGTTFHLPPSKYLGAASRYVADAPRTYLADNGISQGDISGYLFNIGRWECPQSEGTSADGEPLSSAPVCGKESRGLGGDARDMGRLGGGHGSRGRHGGR